MMPFASFHDGEISSGLVKDISEVLAQRMGYMARFHTVPGSAWRWPLRKARPTASAS